ncbi:MAG: DUF417 family protein [Alphaproteobacteria bacterium]|nr:MAG: DUF417 family protein [Alphaproteobacteria bacterium]
MLVTQPRLAPTIAFARFFATASLALVLIWFGLMNISGTSAPVVAKWISGHDYFSGLKQYDKFVMYGLGIVQIFCGLVIALQNVPERTRRAAYWAVIALSGFSLTLLLTNPVWDQSLGGFPAIGAGQGLIKYVAIIGLALWCLHNKHGDTIMLLGLILVLGWIGAMKFTAPEAEGIAPLLKTSPAFSWMLNSFSLRTASNIIGAIEIGTALLLTARWWNSTAYGLGLLFCVYTFAATLSFLITFKAAWTGVGMPYLSSAGQFLLKDLLLLAATLVLASERR